MGSTMANEREREKQRVARLLRETDKVRAARIRVQILAERMGIACGPLRDEDVVELAKRAWVRAEAVLLQTGNERDKLVREAEEYAFALEELKTAVLKYRGENVNVHTV